MRRAGCPYSNAERDQVRELWQNGSPSRYELAAAAAKMNRSISSIKNMSQHLKLSANGGKNPAFRKPEAAPITYTNRKCLRCQGAFQSWGFGNRLCDKCRASQDWSVGTDYAIAGQP